MQAEYAVKGTIRRTLVKQCLVGDEPVFNESFIGKSNEIIHYTLDLCSMVDLITYWNRDGGGYWSYELLLAVSVPLSSINKKTPIIESPFDYYLKDAS